MLVEGRTLTAADFDAVGTLLVRAYEGAWGPDGCVAVVAPTSTMRSIADAAGLEVRMLAVDPSAQRQGVARQLIVAAHALYDALGFRRRADLDTVVGDGYRALGYELEVTGRSMLGL